MGNRRPYFDEKPNSAVMSRGGKVMKCLLLILLALPLSGGVSRLPGGAACSSHPCTLAVTCPTSQCAATDIQAAINEAQLGDTITIQAGVVWTVASPLTLYRKTTGSGQLTIRTSTDDSLIPADGVRITAAYKPLLPELRLTNSNASLITVEQTANAVENYTFLGIWFSAAQGVDSAYDLIHLWVGQSNWRSVSNASNATPVTLTVASTAGFSNGDHVEVDGNTGNRGANGWWVLANVTATTMDLVGSHGTGASAGSTAVQKTVQWDASQTPNNIVFDRCLVLAAPLSGIRQGLRVAGRNITIKNSYCDQIKNQSDSQCVSMPSTPGPVAITNNFLGGGPGETILTGGAIPNLAGPDGTGQNATDLTITHNAIYKDPALYKYENWSPAMWVRQGKVINGGNGSKYIAVTSGTTGSTAPTFPTTKCADRFAPDAGCSAIDGGVTWERNWFVNSDKWTFKNLLELKTADRVTVKWNTLDGAWVDAQTGEAVIFGEGMQGYIGIGKTEHVELANNVVRNHMLFAVLTAAGDYGNGITDDINIHDNLVLPGKGNGGGFYTMWMAPSRTVPSSTIPPYFSGLRIVHNTIERSTGAAVGFWYFGTGPAPYDSPVISDNLFNISGNPYPLICSACPSYAARKAALDNKTVGGYTFRNNVVAGENLFSWPTGNFDTAWGAIGFTDTGKADYRLRNGSPFVGRGTDGKDLGADTTQLPLIRDLTVTPTDRAALFTWSATEPIRDIACVIEVSTDRDLSTAINDLDPTRYARPETSDHDRLPKNDLSRTLIIGANAALASGTTYWYRLHCGGAFEQGSFTTLAPLTGNSALSITKRARRGSDHFDLEWGTSYSRADDTISGGGVATAACNPRGACAATFQVPSGSVAYYRIREQDASGGTISGPVMVRAALGQGY
jgi:hypothetical protein